MAAVTISMTIAVMTAYCGSFFFSSAAADWEPAIIIAIQDVIAAAKRRGVILTSPILFLRVAYGKLRSEYKK